jgi:DNA-binding NtrC family response regulator
MPRSRAADEDLSTIRTLGSHDAPPGSVLVRILQDEVVSTRLLSPGARLIAGRSPEVDLHLPHASISRRHAAIEVGPPTLIEDLGSANGTRVGGRVLGAGERVSVGPGVTVGIGKVTLVFELQGDAPTEAPAPSRDDLPAPRDVVERIAQGEINVLLFGETGVGKEVMAETIHKLSRRAAGPLVRLNCAALLEPLLVSELFGHEKGAFSGADQAKPGLLETAAGGTVLLDEIGELSLNVQAKLLRVLEERAVLRIGALKPRPIDVRFIAATNRDLEVEVERGAFRADLLFRLDGFSFTIPPLRDRRGEIAGLARSFAARAAARLGRATAPEIDPTTLAHLEAYGWPGNVRELKNVIERAVLLSGGAALAPEHLPLEKMRRASTTQRSVDPAMPPPSAAPRSEEELRAELVSAERARILEVLATCAGNQTRAAKQLGISRNTLATKLSSFGVPRPRKGS